MYLKYKILFVTLIVSISAIFIPSCADANPTSSQVINAPTIIPTKTIPPTPFPQISVGTVLVNNLNVRSGPGTNYGVIGSMKRGEEFYILADTNNLDNKIWFLILLPNNSFGWVIGESSYVTDNWVSVDYTTYKTVEASVRRAKLIYDATPTLEVAATPRLNRTPLPPPPVQSGNCHPSYPDGCLQVGIGDYDCAGGSGNGPNYVRGPFRVLRPDPFDLDRDRDGIGCE